jgi:alkylation response protein AidB-like acyl-CoA dehydrogenase
VPSRPDSYRDCDGTSFLNFLNTIACIMNFEVSELTHQVAQTARDFARQHIKQHVMDWDENQEFPLPIFKELGKLGMMGVFVPHEYGGAGLSYFEYKTIIEEIAKVCGSIGLSVAAHNSLCTGHILAFGTKEKVFAKTGYSRMDRSLGTDRSQYRQ